jgi:hypothetical protein
MKENDCLFVLEADNDPGWWRAETRGGQESGFIPRCVVVFVFYALSFDLCCLFFFFFVLDHFTLPPYLDSNYVDRLSSRTRPMSFLFRQSVDSPQVAGLTILNRRLDSETRSQIYVISVKQPNG